MNFEKLKIKSSNKKSLKQELEEISKEKFMATKKLEDYNAVFDFNKSQRIPDRPGSAGQKETTNRTFNMQMQNPEKLEADDSC